MLSVAAVLSLVVVAVLCDRALSGGRAPWRPCSLWWSCSVIVPCPGAIVVSVVVRSLLIGLGHDRRPM